MSAAIHLSRTQPIDDDGRDSAGRAVLTGRLGAEAAEQLRRRGQQQGFQQQEVAPATRLSRRHPQPFHAVRRQQGGEPRELLHLQPQPQPAV